MHITLPTTNTEKKINYIHDIQLNKYRTAEENTFDTSGSS